jgi:hypothetical protein
MPNPIYGHSPHPSGTMFGYDNSTEKYVVIAVDTNGIIKVQGSDKVLKTIPFSISSTGTVISAVTSKIIKVYAIKCIVSAAMSINFRDGSSTDIEGAMPIAANGGYVESVTPPSFILKTTAGNSLDLVITGTGTVSGRISYWDGDET